MSEPLSRLFLFFAESSVVVHELSIHLLDSHPRRCVVRNIEVHSERPQLLKLEIIEHSVLLISKHKIQRFGLPSFNILNFPSNFSFVLIIVSVSVFVFLLDLLFDVLRVLGDSLHELESHFAY